MYNDWAIPVFTIHQRQLHQEIANVESLNDIGIGHNVQWQALSRLLISMLMPCRNNVSNIWSHIMQKWCRVLTHAQNCSKTAAVVSHRQVPIIADRTIGRAYGTVCRLSSVVSDVLYCGKTVHPSQKVSEGVNRKPGSKSSFFGSPPYFYFRFRRYGPLDGRFLPYVLWRNGTS